MKHRFQSSEINHGLDFLISADWTPEQALAVVELLDDLRDRILSHYQNPIQELLIEQYGPPEDFQEEIHNWDEMDF